MVTVKIEKGYVRTSLKFKDLRDACIFVSLYGKNFELDTDFIISMDDPEQDKEDADASDV